MSQFTIGTTILLIVAASVGILLYGIAQEIRRIGKLKEAARIQREYHSDGIPPEAIYYGRRHYDPKPGKERVQ